MYIYWKTNNSRSTKSRCLRLTCYFLFMSRLMTTENEKFISIFKLSISLNSKHTWLLNYVLYTAKLCVMWTSLKNWFVLLGNYLQFAGGFDAESMKAFEELRSRIHTKEGEDSKPEEAWSILITSFFRYVLLSHMYTSSCFYLYYLLSLYMLAPLQ